MKKKYFLALWRVAKNHLLYAKINTKIFFLWLTAINWKPNAWKWKEIILYNALNCLCYYFFIWSDSEKKHFQRKFLGLFKLSLKMLFHYLQLLSEEKSIEWIFHCRVNQFFFFQNMYFFQKVFAWKSYFFIF